LSFSGIEVFVTFSAYGNNLRSVLAFIAQVVMVACCHFGALRAPKVCCAWNLARVGFVLNPLASVPFARLFVPLQLPFHTGFSFFSFEESLLDMLHARLANALLLAWPAFSAIVKIADRLDGFAARTRLDLYNILNHNVDLGKRFACDQGCAKLDGFSQLVLL
jgi:hypothetical protein